MNDDDMLVFAGSGSKGLTSRICSYLSIKPARNETLCFSEGNIFVRVLENIRGRHAYLVQSTMFSPNDKFMELLFWIDALRRASAASFVAASGTTAMAKSGGNFALGWQRRTGRRLRAEGNR